MKANQITSRFKQPQPPLRLTPRMAAEQLGIHHETMLLLLKRGIFTVTRPSGKAGPGRRVYLTDPQEVEIYARSQDGEAAVREYRAQRDAKQQRTRKPR